MFQYLDRWMHKKASEENVSLNPSVARWGILQIIIGISLFAFAVSVSFTALFLSLWSLSMGIAIVALVLAILFAGGGVFVSLYWLHLGKRWAMEGSKDTTASTSDIEQIGKDLDSKFNILISEIKGLRDDLRGHQNVDSK